MFGIPLKAWSVHYPFSMTELGPPNVWHHQTEHSRAILADATPPGGDFIVGGDLNASFSDPPFKPFRDRQFVLDNPDYPGLMYIFHAGRNIRPLSSAVHKPRLTDGKDLSDHALVEAYVSVEEPTEQRFRAISDWTANSAGRYLGAWATMHMFVEPRFGFEFIVFKSGHVEWRDVPGTEQLHSNTRTRFTAAHDWAVQNG